MLLVHGFTGTPFEMRPLGEALAALGLSVEAPLLAGHGQPGLIAGTRALAATGWPDWLASVERAFDRLRARVTRVTVCGLSLGGLLTLELARRRQGQLAAVASLSAPLWLTPAAERGLQLARRFPLMQLLAMPKLAGSDVRDPEMRRLNNLAQGRAAMPFRAVVSLSDLQARVRAGLGEVNAPALLMHSEQDHTAPFACMAELARLLGTPAQQRTEIVLTQSFHVITLDVERQRVFDAVAEHVIGH